MNINKAFGLALQQARKSRKMSQEDFSAVSSRTYISTLERGLKSPTLEKVEKICNELNLHPLSLFIIMYSSFDTNQSQTELLESIIKELRQIEKEH